MSLTLAYAIAREGLAASGGAAGLVSRNIANANSPNAAAKSVVLANDASGGVRIASIVSAVNAALLEKAASSASSTSELSTISNALDQLNIVVGDPGAGTSVAELIGQYRGALQSAASAPQDHVAAGAVVAAASAAATALNNTASEVSQVRNDANASIAMGVQKLSGMLQDFKAVNGQIVLGTAEGSDVTDLLDKRNGIVRDISELVAVRPSLRAGNDMTLSLANGTTLFEASPREIAFGSPTMLGPGQVGPLLRIDGMPIENGAELGGQLGGLLQVRDDIALKFGRQADEIARGLILSTAESSQPPGSGKPDLAGLFTYSNGPNLPPPGSVIDGLAASIVVNPNVDPAEGGLLSRLRDGGISNPADSSYVANSSGASGYSERLLAILDQTSANQSFDSTAGLSEGNGGVLAFASESASWLASQRSTTSNGLDSAKIESTRTTGAWQNTIGISIDNEMTTLIGLQRSYQASSRLITSIDAMYDTLFRAIG